MAESTPVDNFKAVNGGIFTGGTTTHSVRITHRNLWTGFIIVTAASTNSGFTVACTLLEESYSAGSPPSGVLTMSYTSDFANPQ
jgi:hypothetical protein